MIGIDIIEIKRFEKITEDDFSSWSKVFTKDEWGYSFTQPLPAQHLAGIFAAKEAVMKIVGKQLMKRFDLIEVTHNSEGKPMIHFLIHTTDRVSVSISHNTHNAVAVSLLL